MDEAETRRGVCEVEIMSPRAFARELGEFVKAGLTDVNFEDYVDAEDPPVRRFRAEYRRPS